MSAAKSDGLWICVNGVWVPKPAPAEIKVVGFKPATKDGK
jgi:hypothetical protein